jgi:hypothetical protein
MSAKPFKVVCPDGRHHRVTKVCLSYLQELGVIQQPTNQFQRQQDSTNGSPKKTKKNQVYNMKRWVTAHEIKETAAGNIIKLRVSEPTSEVSAQVARQLRSFLARLYQNSPVW